MAQEAHVIPSRTNCARLLVGVSPEEVVVPPTGACPVSIVIPYPSIVVVHTYPYPPSGGMNTICCLYAIVKPYEEPFLPLYWLKLAIKPPNKRKNDRMENISVG
jgi:hypothetical protein